MISLITNSIALGFGLAMDAFSVSIADGLNHPDMKKQKSLGIAGTFGLYQTAMPLIGWLCVHTIANIFTAFQKFIPWIALLLLGFIGGKMIIDSIKGGEEEESTKGKLTFGVLMVQGIATSIDALSVGFTIAELDFGYALLESVIIGVLTFFICVVGLLCGKKFGEKLAGKATIVGGIILIIIGIKILIESFM